jgi:magnesium transporter
MDRGSIKRDPLISGLGPAELAECRHCRQSDRFFWLDVMVDGAELTAASARDRLNTELQVPEHALNVLFDFSEETPPLRKYHADGDHVVFAFNSITRPEAPLEEGALAIDPVEVHVLVHGDYLLTVHDRPARLQPAPEESPPVERGEKYLVFFALFEMTITLFEALNYVGEQLQKLEGGEVEGAATDLQTIHSLRARLTELRRVAGRQSVLFSHVAEEIEQVRGLGGSGQYFERIDSQLGRLVNGLDAVGQALASLIDQGMNRIMFRLTVVATIFLPLTVITGFFGMNFGWLVGHIAAGWTFWIYGLGSLVGAIVLSLIVMRRELPVLLKRD